MKKHFKGTSYHYAKLIIGFVIGSFLLASCNENPLEVNEPQWLGASIYDYLKTDGHYTNYIKLIDDLNYAEVLAKTGSKTLFVAKDSAFNEFFKKNDWGVNEYAQLSLAQKKMILNFGMINDAYLVEMLSNYNPGGGLVEGGGMRKTTAVSVLDSLQFENGLTLPESPYWNNYRFKGIYILKDNTPWTMMYFTQKQMDQSRITNEDFRILTGLSRNHNDAHLFGNKIIKRDITSKNGYLNVLQSVMTPPANMAQYVDGKANLSMFAKLLERFSAPYYDPTNTILYKQTHPLFTDTIFTKKYFSKFGGMVYYPTGGTISSDLLLPFDPGWNTYSSNANNPSGAPMEADMAAMFVPTNDAMNQFFNSGAGAVLKDRFGSWDNVPNTIIPLFLKRHMRSSLMQTLPSKFSAMVDDDNSALRVKTNDITNVFIGRNGIVYETNQVYPPDDYGSVYGPALLSANDVSPLNKTKIWNWAITQNEFRLYLNSMVSRYSFFVPTDDYFTKYIDPIAFAQDRAGALKFWYNTKTSSVCATVYSFDKKTGLMGDSIAVIKSVSQGDDASVFLKGRLLDMLNMHIVVGGVESGKEFYLTKGNVALKILGSGTDMTIQGGENMDLNDPVRVIKDYNQTNGHTYFIDKPIQAPLKSVFKILSTQPEFSAFFTLLNGFPGTTPTSPIIFVNKTNYYGIDFNVKLFNTFNYTVYVPTNDAINKAITDGIITPWDSQGNIVGINDMTDASVKTAAIAKLERFVRYHFQDNSVFLDGQSVNTTFQSATIKTDDLPSGFNTFKNKYYKIGVSGSGRDLTLTTENNQQAHVVTSGGLYNIMTRDLTFKDKPTSYNTIDKSATGIDFLKSAITTSSTAVIHQIDAVLNFQ